jgi:phosphoribosylaminoimidazole (AIR) synthetase
MVVILDQSVAEQALEILKQNQIEAVRIGHIEEKTDDIAVRIQ